jgi:hypothetical protein
MQVHSVIASMPADLFSGLGRTLYKASEYQRDQSIGDAVNFYCRSQRNVLARWLPR